MLKNIAILIIISCFANVVHAQEAENWDLERCMRYAADNNLQIKQAAISIRQAELTEKQGKLSRLPNLNANASHSYNFGRSIDPTTNSFESRTIQANGIGLNTGGIIYGGGQINNTIKQSRLDIAAAQADAERIKNDLGLTIAQAYLQVLLAQDQVQITENRLKQTQEQLTRTQKLVQAGAVAPVNLLDLEAQVAADQQSIITAQNAVIQALAALKLQLNLDPTKEMTITRPDFDLPDDKLLGTMTIQNLYEQALQNQPQIIAADLREESAAIGTNLAKAGLRPTLSYFGNLSSNYSNLAQRTTGETTTITQNFGDIDIPNIGTVPLEISQQIPEFENNPFFSQINENFRQAIGISLNIPIYNQGQNSINIERAELGIRTAELNSEQTRIQLKSDIQNALIDARAAQTNLQAAQKTLEARQTAFDSAQKRYDLGTLNTFDFTAAKDALDIAKINLLNTRYQYVFSLKVLDFYLGKKIEL